MLSVFDVGGRGGGVGGGGGRDTLSRFLVTVDRLMSFYVSFSILLSCTKRVIRSSQVAMHQTQPSMTDKVHLS